MLEKYLVEKSENIADYLDAEKAWKEHKKSGDKAVRFEEVFKN